MNGNIRKRGNSWQLTWDVKVPGGKRKQRYLTVRGNKRDAQRKLREVLRSLDSGNYVDPSKRKVGEYLLSWLANRKHVLSPTTYDVYRANMEAHLVPALGEIRLQQLTWEALEQYVEQRSDSLSGQTLSHHMRLLSRALKDAVKKGYVTRNVVGLVDNTPKIKRKKIEAFDAQNNQRLVDLFSGEMKTIVALALTTGMRRGEIAGLKWDAVGEGVLKVERVLTQTREGLILRDEPKTEGSFRKITLTKGMTKELLRHKARQAKDKLIAGNAYQDQGFVFARFDGEPIKPALMTRTFSKSVKGTDFHLTFHGLRHCHVSQLIAANVNIKTIQQRVGHTTIKTTLDTYGHLLPGMDEAAAEAIEGTISL